LELDSLRKIKFHSQIHSSSSTVQIHSALQSISIPHTQKWHSHLEEVAAEIAVDGADLEAEEAVTVADEEVFREVVAEVSFYISLELNFRRE
jgi:hypothetical protein